MPFWGTGDDVLITTTQGIEGRRITAYHGLVTGEAISGVNIVRDFFASIRDIVGGRSAAYEKELKRAREAAIDEMVQEARMRGANAVIGLDIDYESIGKNGSMLMVSVSGTAVTLTT